MKKNYFFVLFFLFIVFIFLVSCKNSREESTEEKNKCFNKCMLVEEDKAYCLDDCNLEANELEEKEEKGPEETQPECTADTDCGEKQICKEDVCKPVDCTEDTHCPSLYSCKENVCTKEIPVNETMVEELSNEISELVDVINVTLNELNSLQDSLDSADASAEDKAEVQEDIDALDGVSTKLETYIDILEGYSNDLDEAKTGVDVTAVENTFEASGEEIEAYINIQQAKIDAIKEAISDLKPTEKPDLIVDDLDLEDVDGNDATFTLTFKNDDDGNITTETTFRVRLTSFDDDNAEVDDSKTTITTGLEPDEESELELEIELPYSIEEHFKANNSLESFKLLFLTEVDIDDSVNESNETNNNRYFNITFSRDDYVSNTAPVANINITPANASVAVNETVTFSATGSTDSDGSISSYNWDFGDTYSSTSSSPSHSYTIAGTYKVILTVTDNEAATDTETAAVSVI